MSRELPEVLEKQFVICDNTVNRKGWRLLVQGIDLEGFMKNPVCCVEHDTWRASIGKWKDVHVEGEQLIGTLEFDKNDPDAVKLYWKYEDGYMSAVSLHIIALEESVEQGMLLPGQQYATITKSELLEVSVVTVPGQKNAVRLSSPQGGEYKLNLIDNNIEMKENENQEMTARIAELEAQLSASQAKNAEMLVAMHVQRGAVQEGEIESLKELAMTNYDTVEKLLTARKVEDPKVEAPKKNDDEAKRLAEAIEKLNAGEKPQPNERDSWSYMDYMKKDRAALSAMEKDNPEKFAKLVEDFMKESENKGINVE